MAAAQAVSQNASQAADAPAQAAPPRVVRPLNETRIILDASTLRTNFFRAVAEEGTPVSDPLKPAFWAMALRMGMKSGDEITVVNDEASWYLKLLVRDMRPDGVLVGLLQKVEFDADFLGSQDEGAFKVQWKGEMRRFVVFGRHGEALKENFATRIDANTWARDYAAATAG